jgi:hypothetical protein
VTKNCKICKRLSEVNCLFFKGSSKTIFFKNEVSNHIGKTVKRSFLPSNMGMVNYVHISAEVPAYCQKILSVIRKPLTLFLVGGENTYARVRISFSPTQVVPVIVWLTSSGSARGCVGSPTQVVPVVVCLTNSGSTCG